MTTLAISDKAIIYEHEHRFWVLAARDDRPKGMAPNFWGLEGLALYCATTDIERAKLKFNKLNFIENGN